MSDQKHATRAEVPDYFRRNVEGRRNGYSGCGKCGDTWNWKEPHSTIYNEYGTGCFPLCKECWQKLTPEQRLPFYMQLVDLWESQSEPPELPRLQRVREAITRAVLEGK